MSIDIGTPAPNFSLLDQHGAEVRLDDFRGQPVVLVFYPLAFSGICTGELCTLRDNYAQFSEPGVNLLAISVDSHHTLRAFAEQEGYDFTLLADFWPHGGVAREYGVFIEETGVANRATFVIDGEGIVRGRLVTAPGQARDFAWYQQQLAELRK